MATDVRVEPLQAIDATNVNVCRYDLRSDDVPGLEFDLAYARLVVEYVGTETIGRLANTLRPGGLMLLADYDWASFAASPGTRATAHLISLVLELMISLGLDPYFGARLPEELRGAELLHVGMQREVRTIQGGSFESGLLRRVIETPSATLIEAGAIDGCDLATALDELADPHRSFVSPTLVAAWGSTPTQLS